MAVVGEHHERLADFIRALPNFTLCDKIDGDYDHVGATLADAVLQANNNYERNVRYRIDRIRKEYADYTTLSDLDRLLGQITLQEFLKWNGTRKPTTMLRLLDVLRDEGVDTEKDIRDWLEKDENRAKLLEIRFIGKKTVDYLGILVGRQAAAMDRHLFEFLRRAEIPGCNYENAQTIIHQAADLMNMPRSHLDHSIWRYMSARASTSPVVSPRIVKQLVVRKKRRCPRIGERDAF